MIRERSPRDREMTRKVLEEIAAERDRQVSVHGMDQDHDDRLEVPHWAWLLSKRSVALSCPVEELVQDPRRQLLEIAAISVAALEAMDRRGTGYCRPHLRPRPCARCAVDVETGDHL